MTKQEYYDLLVKSASDGTFPSYSSEERKCMYRKDGTANCKARCAVGLLIPDCRYKVRHEWTAIEDLKDVIELPEDMTIADLYAVQNAHDRVSTATHVFAFCFVLRLNELDCFKQVRKQEAT